MTIIELCGLPGCGKSTLCGNIMEELKLHDVDNVYGRNDVMRYRYGFFSKILNRLRLYRCSPFILHKLIKAYTIDITSDPRYVKRLVRLFAGLNKLSEDNNVDVVLLDEGIVEHVVSLAYGVKILDNETLQELMKLMFTSYNVIVINCHIDIDESIRRIKTRNKKNARYDYANSDDIKRLFEFKKNNIDTVLNHFHGKRIDLDMNASQDEALTQFYKFISFTDGKVAMNENN